MFRATLLSCLAAVLKFKKSKLRPKDLRAELLKGPHPILYFLGHWREDLSMISYSAKLGYGVALLTSYER